MNVSDETLARQIGHQIDGIVLTSMSEENEEVPIRVRLENGDISCPERVFSVADRHWSKTGHTHWQPGRLGGGVAAIQYPSKEFEAM